MIRIQGSLLALFSLATAGFAQEPIRILTLDSTRDTHCGCIEQELNIATGSGYSRVREVLFDQSNFGMGGIIGRPIEFLPQVPEFTPTALAKADIVLTNGHTPHLSMCESLTLAEFVRQGGGVFAFWNNAAESPGVAFDGTMNPNGTAGTATIDDPSSPLIAGPFGTVVGPIGFQFHRVFADLGPIGHSVLSTFGPLCAVFGLGAGRAVIIGDEEWCNNAPGCSLCGHGFLPDSTRERLFMNCVAAVLPDASFQYVPTVVCSPSIGTQYCLPAPTNSTGLAGLLRAEGTTLASANNVTLIAEQLPANVFAMFLASEYEDYLSPVHNSQGALCLGGFVGRFTGPEEIQSSGPQGTISLQIDLISVPTSLGFEIAEAGETWYFQAWHRDSNPNVTSNFTSAVSITFE